MSKVEKLLLFIEEMGFDLIIMSIECLLAFGKFEDFLLHCVSEMNGAFFLISEFLELQPHDLEFISQ